MKNQLVVWLAIPLLFLFLQISASEKQLIKPYERPIESTHQQIRWYQCLFLRTQKKLSPFLTQLILAYLTFTPSSPVIPLGQHLGGLEHGRLSSNGHWFLSVPVAQGFVYLLDVTTGVRIRTFTAPSLLYSCALATRLTFIAAVGQHLYLWDTRSGKLTTTLPNDDESFIMMCHIFCDDTKIMTTGNNQKITIWQKAESHQWACLNVLRGHTAEIWDSKVSNNNEFIVSMDETSTICLWKSKSADCHDVLTEQSEVFNFHHVFTGHSEDQLDAKSSCVFSDDTRYIGSITYLGEIKLWDIAYGTCIHTVALEDPKAVLEMYQISYISAERILWWTAHKVGMWNFMTNKKEYILLFGEETQIVNVSVSGDRRFLMIVQKKFNDPSWIKINLYHFTSGNPLV